MKARKHRSMTPYDDVDEGAILAQAAAAPNGTRRLDRLASRRKAINRATNKACESLRTATLPLADLVEAACGRLAPPVINAVKVTMDSRQDKAPDKWCSKRPPGKPMRPADCGSLFRGLEKAAHRLLPVFDRLDRQEAELQRDLRRMIPDKIQRLAAKGHRAFPEVKNVWLLLLSGSLSNWRRYVKHHWEYTRPRTVQERRQARAFLGSTRGEWERRRTNKATGAHE